MFKKITIVLCLLLITYANADKQALLVGVSDYGGNPRNDLPGIEKDIVKMENLFRSWGFGVKKITNADSVNLKAYLKHYGETLSSSDTFALYYSGHGSYVADSSGDEGDGQDEALVLSDGVNNTPFIDDEFNHYLNRIQAKKLIILDSCHSGTAHKGSATTRVPKTLPTKELVRRASKGLEVKGEELSGEYMVLSAAQDKEESLATSEGSLFTNELYTMFTSDSNRPLASIKEEITYNIVSSCKRWQDKPHHPNFSYANSAYRDGSIYDYLKVNEASPQPYQEVVAPTPTLQTALEQMVADPKLNQITISSTKGDYMTGERVTFSLDTHGYQGNLTVLFVDSSSLTVLYPNPRSPSKVIQGRYSFPKDFGNFGLKAFKNCNGCQKDKTDIYLLLTPQPLSNVANMSRDKLLKFAKGSTTDSIVSKDVELVFDSVEPEQKSDVVVGKYGFWVE